MKPGNMVQIEGLRAYLALWVALGHGLQTAGYLHLPGPFGLLLQGDAAVAVFIIVSGFVITHLLLRGGETYPQYLCRRFFRLYPAYVVCCLAGLLVAGIWTHLVLDVSWREASGWDRYAQGVLVQYASVTEQFWANIFWHATMLHGLVPNEVVPRAPMTLLPAAWSVSLEWQFYLIAPLVVAACRNHWRLAGVVAVAAILYVLHRKGVFGTYAIASSIAGSSPYFAVGILSRFAYERLRGLPWQPVAAALLVLFLLLAFSTDPLPLAIWLPFYAFLLWGANAPRFGRAFDLLMANRAALYVGGISYTLYLVHRPVQVLAGYAALRAMPDISQPMMLAVEWGSILFAIPAAIMLSRWVERPGMEAGRRLSRRLAAAPAQPAAG